MHLFEDLPLPEMVEEEDGYKHEVGCDWRGVPGTMPKAERERIALEEGARAEYWLVSRENLGSAALSWLCYVVGGLLLGVILLKQAHSVGHAAGFGLWGFRDEFPSGVRNLVRVEGAQLGEWLTDREERGEQGGGRVRRAARTSRARRQGVARGADGVVRGAGGAGAREV